jgi:curved DNA-binding protein
MEFKDYYATLGIAHDATQAQVKHAYRKQARKYHPDVSKEPDAEAQFKLITEANEALNDVERRAAYDEVVERRKNGKDTGPEFNPPPGWDSGFEFSGRGADGAGGPPDFGHSDFFEALFGRQSVGARGPRPPRDMAGGDHHAKVEIDLLDAYRGASRSISLRMPQVDAQGRMGLHTRQLDVNIPKGVRGGQHLRLAGQGGPGLGQGAAGDLYLEIEFAPTAPFRLDGRDVYLDLPVSPWEAALGAEIAVPTPDGSVQVTVPGGSSPGLKLRLRGKGIPSTPPGDLYAVLTVSLPKADTDAGREAYRALAKAFADHRPRRSLEGAPP